MADETPATTEEREGLFKLVNELKDAVGEMKKGSLDEAAVRVLVTDAMQASRRVGVVDRPEGFVPEDLDEDGAKDALGTRGKFARLDAVGRFRFMLDNTPARVAPLVRKSTDQIAEFQKANDELVLLAAMTKQSPEELDYYHDVFAPLRDAAMDTKTTGEGKELVATTELSSDLIDRIEGELQVLNMFPSVTMPTNPFEFPVKGPRRHVAVLAEAIEAGTPKAKQLLPAMPTKISLAATKFAGEIITSKELEEDAAIAILPFLEAELIEWLRYDLEDACLNGDAAPPHMDSGVAADDPKMGWDGLRKLTPTAAKVDGAGAALTPNSALQARAKMGRYGLSSAALRWIVSVPSLYALLADKHLVTVDQYGAGATILSGEIGRLWGSPVIASDQIPVTCDATGVIPASPGALTLALVVNPGWYMHGVRRATTVQILTELYAESDQDAVMVTTRQAFAARYPGEPTVAQIYNLATTIPALT